MWCNRYSEDSTSGLVVLDKVIVRLGRPGADERFAAVARDWNLAGETSGSWTVAIKLEMRSSG